MSKNVHGLMYFAPIRHLNSFNEYRIMVECAFRSNYLLQQTFSLLELISQFYDFLNGLFRAIWGGGWSTHVSLLDTILSIDCGQ